MAELSEFQEEYMQSFLEDFTNDNAVFSVQAVTHISTGDVYPCLLMQVDDDITIVGIISTPGDGFTEEFDLNDDSTQGENRVGGVEFVYSNDGVEDDEEVEEERPGLLKRFSQRLLNR